MFYKIKKIYLISILALAFFLGMFLPVLAAGGKHIIVIDPSHGGQDTGVKIKDRIDEKDITLIIALALQKELAQESNLQIILTRDSDRELSLEERKKNVAKIKPDFFLSLHINSGFGKTASGFELYYPGFKDTAERKAAVKLNAQQAKNKYLNDSIKMSHLIQRNLDAVFPRKGRGLREANLPIIDGLFVPALVVEIGFATNSEDKKKLLSPITQVEIAQALAKSIKSFFR
jgi:N-acetylmuramoyl-L-alanine amidase